MADSPINIDQTAQKIKSLFQDGTRIVGNISNVVNGRVFSNKSGLNSGAAAPTPQPAKPQFGGVEDFRPRLQIPVTYLNSSKTSGPNGVIFDSKGIIFPYTPIITQDYRATYTSMAPTHSNYAIYSYKNSAPGTINLNAKFTVQNETDAHYFLSTIHILRALTKMKFGSDDDAGAPPPVCRLYAYGDYVFNNVPVALENFQLKLDNDCDYFSTSLPVNFNGQNTVPTISSITLSLIPMYSRNEMLKFNVNQWINGTLREGGYL
jgi:hypothetical protein